MRSLLVYLGNLGDLDDLGDHGDLGDDLSDDLGDFFFIFIVAHSGPQEHSFVKE